MKIVTFITIITWLFKLGGSSSSNLGSLQGSTDFEQTEEDAAVDLTPEARDKIIQENPEIKDYLNSQNKQTWGGLINQLSTFCKRQSCPNPSTNTTSKDPGEATSKTQCKPIKNCLNRISTLLSSSGQGKNGNAGLASYCKRRAQSLDINSDGQSLAEFSICSTFFHDANEPMEEEDKGEKLDKVSTSTAKDDGRDLRTKNIILRLNRENCLELVSARLFYLVHSSGNLDDAIALDCIKEYLEAGPGYQISNMIKNFQECKRRHFGLFKKEMLDDYDIAQLSNVSEDLKQQLLKKKSSICTLLLKDRELLPKDIQYQCEGLLLVDRVNSQQRSQ